MTDERRARAPMGPPWPVDLLADLDAGALDADTEATLRPQVQADPDARDTLAALEHTRKQLASLPPLTMPEEVAGRIEAALAAEALAAEARAAPAGQDQPPARPAASGVTDLAAARRRRARRLGWGGGLLAAAAVAVGIVVLTLPPGHETGGTPPPQAGQAPTAGSTAGGAASGSGPLALRSGELGGSVGQVIGAADYGPLRGPDALGACLRASNVPNPGKPLGVRQVLLDGQPRVLAVLPAGKLGTYRLLVIEPNCGAGHSGVLSDTTIGAR
jgi:hypothetical protein